MLISATALVAAATLGSASLAAAAPAPVAESAPAAADVVAGVTWGPCQSPGLIRRNAECGFVSVPLDYGKPSGAKAQIAISRIKHTVPDAQYQGIMLVNPGGPGGSGLTLSILGEFVPNGAGAAYDWIGFDPRGVGSSTPALSCDPNYAAGPRPIYEPTTAAIEKAWLAKSKAYAKACGTAGGSALLSNLRTTDSVRDMDRIRLALGEKKLNFYGFSYGTYLGQVYATMYPDKVRRMVLDSNVDPRKVWYQANLDQDVAFETTETAWWAWLAKYDSVYHLGKTEKQVEALWYAERAKLAKNPAGGVVGASEWSDIFLSAGYYQITWLDLADLWATWNATHADPQPLVDTYNDGAGVGDDNSFAMYLGVQCVDASWPRDWSTWREDNWRTYKKAPFLTWGNAWFNAPCAFWPVKSSRPVEVTGRGVAPILLVGETLDAATPYEGSLEVRSRFPNSRLIGLPGGTSHAMSLFDNACLDNQIAAYLADGTRPSRKSGRRADTTCAPLPVPDPTAAAGAAAQKAAPGGADRAELAALLHTGRR